MEIDEEKFKKLFPHLYREIVARKMSIRLVPEYRPTEESGKGPEKSPPMPTAIDYLRRCENDEEAIQVIDYLERRGEIDGEEAERLRRQVLERGVRSFGPKREWGYYSKAYGDY